MDKKAILVQEIQLINDTNIKRLVIAVLEECPDYFYIIPASSGGKYHPLYTLGEGGLIRHTKAAVKIANDLLTLEMYKSLTPKRDQILAALILHDCCKNGYKAVYTVTEHPLIASKLIKDVAKKNNIQDEFVEEICSIVETHMGQWINDFYTKQPVLEKPTTAIQKFAHQCDYLASRRYLTVEL